ncbi:MAG: NAD(P)/FAD-dependent oxidoreductase [Spirochaetales bacterium]|nr:NAD(P)/FAD-dependent oxidoreductase [Candidatus Physcosoma equi]
MDFDVVVIGGGVIGSSVARYLSLYEMKVLVLEKEEDICSGTSKANSGIVHAGYDPIPGTMKAKLNVKGARIIREESERLGFDYKMNGAFVISFREEDSEKIKALYQRGIQNGVEDMVILSGDEARELEPNLSSEVKEALYLKNSGIVCPFTLTQALAENAVQNGAEFAFDAKVKKIQKTKDGYETTTEDGRVFTSSIVVNAAGVYADAINNMVSSRLLKITAKRGNYMLFDSETKSMFQRTIFQLPTEKGKGVLVTPTAHGNLMIGPTSVATPDKDDSATYPEDLEAISRDALLTSNNIPFRKVITSFSGLRAHEEGDDFILGEAEDAPGFFNAAGIESPGLSCSLAIGEELAAMIAEKMGARKKENPVLKREPIVKASHLSKEERTTLIKKNPSYGRIICRCEEISEGEIIDAITRPLGAKSMDGIKRRVRAGMGRCQGGFCSPRVMELLAEYTGRTMEEITKNAKGSEIITGGNSHV